MHMPGNNRHIYSNFQYLLTSISRLFTPQLEVILVIACDCHIHRSLNLTYNLRNHQLLYQYQGNYQY